MTVLKMLLSRSVRKLVPKREAEIMRTQVVDFKPVDLFR